MKEKKEYKNKFLLDNGYNCYIDGILQPTLDSMVYNLKKDWDFIIIITGDRQVRTGKSVFAMNIAAYLTMRINQFHKINNTFNLNNLFWENEELIKQAPKMPKFSVLQYDEAREGLAAVKAMSKLQQDLMDFFNECGQLNHIFILVLPDFFGLKEEIAVGRSECLINVYRNENARYINMYGDGARPVTVFERGFFSFYNRYTKSNLYDYAKSSRRKNYNIVNRDFFGRFTNNYPLNEEEYRTKKHETLLRFKERHDREAVHRSRSDVIRNKIVWKLKGEGMTDKKISETLKEQYEYNVSREMITKINNLNKAVIT